MNFRSLDDLNHTIRHNLHRLPPTIDVVVGVPRSGMVPASAIALLRNTMLCDIETFVAGSAYRAGAIRPKPQLKLDPASWRSVLLVDDSCLSGRSITEAKRAIDASGYHGKVTSCVVFGIGDKPKPVDLVLETVPGPHVFEWNVMHHPHLAESCVDLDGVLCCDPPQSAWRDGPRYDRFLVDATPLYLPTVEIGAIVTSRLQKYRAQTEDWLHRTGVRFRDLHMLDLASAQERTRLNASARFKAEVYKTKRDARLFIESEHKQAVEIAQISGKPVLSIEAMQVLSGSTMQGALTYLRRKRRSLVRRLAAKLGRPSL